MISYRKVGGLVFVRIGSFQFSYCRTSKPHRVVDCAIGGSRLYDFAINS